MSLYDNDIIDDIIGNDELNQNIRGDGEILSEDDDDDGNKDSQNKNEVIKKVEPKKRSVRNPRPTLNIDVLTGNRGIHTIENYFKDIKFHGKGHEKHDLDEVLKRLQHWAHRMYSAYKFDDVLATIERLSKKKQLQHYMHRYRQDMLNAEKEDEIADVNDDEQAQQLDEPFDEFDALINQQIENSKLPVPITPSTTVNREGGRRVDEGNTSVISSVSDTPKSMRIYHGGTSTPYDHHNARYIPMMQIREEDEDIPIESISHISTPHHQPDAEQAMVVQQQSDIPEFLRNRTDLTAEQLAKIAENRRLAQERLKAKKNAMDVQ